MTVAEDEQQVIGRLLRELRSCQKQRDEIDAELAQAAGHLRAAAIQIELLIQRERSATGAPLSRIDMTRLMHLLAGRESVERKMTQAQDRLRRLQHPGAQPVPAV